MKYGEFINNGKEFAVTTPRTPDAWYNYFFNKHYYMKVSQTGQGESESLSPLKKTLNRSYRYFYIRDDKDGDVFCPAYAPLKSKLDHYSCVHRLGSSTITSSHRDVETSIRMFVPTEGKFEVWTLDITNHSAEEKEISAFSSFSISMEMLGAKTWVEDDIMVKYEFPYHAKFEEKAALDILDNYTFAFSDTKFASYECSETRFFGGEDVTDMPLAVASGKCQNIVSEYDRTAASLQHSFKILPGQTVTYSIIFGCAKDIGAIKELKSKLLQNGAIEAEYQKVQSFYDDMCASSHIETPDDNLNFLVNYWLKKQIAAMLYTHRHFELSCVRNELQDAMGFCMINPKEALGFAIKTLKEQQNNGYIKQWHVIDDVKAPWGLGVLSHKDGTSWLVNCLCIMANQMGDSIFDIIVPYKDGGEGSIYEHLALGIAYMEGDVGQHGLSLFGDGDWTDPINGAGRLGIGESTWTTMAFKYAVLQMLAVCERKGDLVLSEKYIKLAKHLDDAINEHCWDGDWYIAGFDDDGKPFGTKAEAEGSIYLNAQTWAIMSETARGERLDRCLKTIEKTECDVGPIVVYPGYNGWVERVGKLTLKLNGTSENGAAYCHAAMFKAFADCLIGRAEEAYKTIVQTMPTNPDNPTEKNLQIPIFIPNFYFGLVDSPNFGKSSQYNFTGTSAWMHWIVIEYILGITATTFGLKIAPQVPKAWNRFKITRTWKEANYHIEAVRGAVPSISVNGAKIEGNLLPYKDGETFEVLVVF